MASTNLLTRGHAFGGEEQANFGRRPSALAPCLPATFAAAGESDQLRPIEKLCATLVVEAIQAYVQGEQEAKWWLFEEGEGEGQSAVSLEAACLVLDLDAGELRRRLRRLVRVTGLRKEAARTYLTQQIWERTC